MPRRAGLMRARTTSAGDPAGLARAGRWWRWLAGPVALCVALATMAGAARADEVRVAVAANFLATARAITARFAEQTGHRVELAAGSTGRFHAQIVAGAPFDVLLAADAATPERLIASGHAVADSRHTYAVGRLVLWSADPDLVDADGAVLDSDRYTRLALANPKLAPYGAAAIEVLSARGILERVRPRIITGESVGQAWRFVLTGNAELGLVALAQVRASEKPAAGSMWLVPQALYGELRQDAVLLEHGRDNAAARALLEYLRGPAARELIRAHGYGDGD